MGHLKMITNYALTSKLNMNQKGQHYILTMSTVGLIFPKIPNVSSRQIIQQLKNSFSEYLLYVYIINTFAVILRTLLKFIMDTFGVIYRGVMVIVEGNGHGDTSSNPGRD